MIVNLLDVEIKVDKDNKCIELYKNVYEFVSISFDEIDSIELRNLQSVPFMETMICMSGEFYDGYKDYRGSVFFKTTEERHKWFLHTVYVAINGFDKDFTEDEYLNFKFKGEN